MLRKRQSELTIESQSEDEDESASEIDEGDSENGQEPGNGSENQDDDDDQSDAVDVAGPSGLNDASEEKPPKKRKRGIIYISSIPKHMNVTILKEMLGQYAKLGRVFLQPGKSPGNSADDFIVSF